jgi:site-specific DNA-cytosine methylase
MSAYYRSGHREGLSDEQITIPANTSHVAEAAGKQYVVLENVNGVLAVYRVRNDGILKGLKRWPQELNEDM